MSFLFVLAFVLCTATSGDAKELGVTDRWGLLQVAMGHVSFPGRSTRVERCNEAVRLEMAALAAQSDPRIVEVRLVGFSVAGEPSDLAKRRLGAVHRFLVDDRGLEAARVTMVLRQIPAESEANGRTNWVEVFVVFRSEDAGKTITVSEQVGSFLSE